MESEILGLLVDNKIKNHKKENCTEFKKWDKILVEICRRRNSCIKEKSVT